MPFGGLLSLAPALISGGSALAGLFGGSPASNVQLPQMQNNYTNAGGADQGAYSGIGNLSQYNVPAQLLPQYQQIAQQGVNNPYASQYQQGANQTGAAGMMSGGAQTGAALGQLPNVQALMSMGFDPQNALYAQQQNQNQQQNLAMLGQSGVAGTPYGQGVASQANTNFNLGWENQQLQRASTAAQGAGSLLGQIGSATNTGLNQMSTGASLPYSTAQGITGNQLGMLGQAGALGQQAAQLPQQQIQDYLSYLSGSTGQQQANTQTAQLGLNQANMGFQQNQQMGQQLGGALAGLGGGWGTSPFNSGAMSSIGGMPATGAGSPSLQQSNAFALSQGINPY
jgi:hypothetical protein